MISFMKRTFLVTGCLMFLGSTVLADIKLPPLFSDNMVLQKASRVPIWGKADLGESVKIEINGMTSEAVADGQGKWRASLDLSKQGPGPYEMTVTGKNKLTVRNVLVGEVWICSGQSNMAMTVNGVLNVKEEIESSANPNLRHFLVERKPSLTPIEECNGRWEIASPQTTGNFTAVGYFFGRELEKNLKAPVGLLHTSWGGTPAEAWTSKASLETDQELNALMIRQLDDANTYEERAKNYLRDMPAWEESNNRKDTGTKETAAVFADPNAALENWKPAVLPASFQKLGLVKDGAVWFRKEVTIPQDLENKILDLILGTINDYDTVYFNGIQVGATKDTPEFSRIERRYRIPANLVKVGKAILAVRVFGQYGNAGFTTRPNVMRIGALPLSGDWLFKVEFEFPPLSPEVQKSRPVPPLRPNLPNTCTCLYNGMINPVVPYAAAGAIWYQGESNAGRAFQYRRLFPTMITDWRKVWGQGDFPFYFCQLANFMGKADKPRDSAWAELREAQSLTLKLPKTGQAILIDIGEATDIHPRNKQDVGRRLALIALSKTYGKDVVDSGPVYESMTVEDNKVRLKFSSLGGGLVAQPLSPTYQPRTSDPATVPLVRNSPKSDLEGFALCGEDHQWVWADAMIDGTTVVVSSLAVTKPVAVRYAWADNPTCNLYNKAGLPAGPFRTDDFQLVTGGKK